MSLSIRKAKKTPFRFQRDIRLEVIAIIIGFISGIAGFIFRLSVELLDETLFGPHGLVHLIRDHLGLLASIVLIILIPTLGGFIVGFAIYKQFPLAKGHGIPNVLEFIHMRKPIAPKTPIGKFLLSILTIGSGLSAGSEGPIAQIGAGAGSYLGQKVRCTPAESNILIAAGAAAGIAAVFNAPLGGTLFSLEILLATITLHTAIPIAIACIVAVSVNFLILGNLPSVFSVPAYAIETFWELPFVFTLGLLAGFVSILWQKTLYFAENYFDNNKIVLPLNTAIGGSFVGIILVLFSLDLRGAGYPIIHEALGAQFSELTSFIGLSLGLFLFLLCGLKIIATAVSLGSGVSGGIFAPSLFMGATLGAGYAIILNSLFDLNLNIGLYALLGLAALFAGAARAPITMIVITIEMSGDLKLLPPIMLAIIVSFLVHFLFVEESIYTEKIVSKGISSTARTVDELMNFITVDEVMTKEVIAILEDTMIEDLLDVFICYKHLGLPVVDREGNLKGMITLFDLRRVRAQQLAIADMKVSEIMTKERDLIVAYPKLTVKEATDMMHRYVIGRLPVVLRSGDNLKVIGIFTRSDIIQTIESFQDFLEADRSRTKGKYDESVENLMIDVIPVSYQHLKNKVVVISRDIVKEADEFIKQKKEKNFQGKKT